MKAILASSNSGKIREFRHLLEPFGLTIIPQKELTVPSVEETGVTFIENAIIKARHAAAYTKLPALADDSGLVVPALKGEPGIYSARYAGEGATDHKNMAKLLQNMQNLKDAERQAYFYCALVFMRHEDDPVPLIAVGKWHGRLLREPRGEQGFGYDPIFYVHEHACTAAELNGTVKNSISHRAQALKLLSQQFSQQLLST